MNEWIKALHQSIVSDCDPIPNGFCNMRDLAKMWKVSISQAQKRMRRLVDHKLVETKTFRTTDTTGRVYPMPFYKLKKQ